METTIAGLNVERRGRAGAPPLLLIHGVGHRWQMWTPVLDDLARDFDVAAVDLPGFGASPFPPEGATPNVGYLTDAIVGVLDELGWDRPAVAGDSLGGWLSYELAKRGRANSATGLAPAGVWVAGRPPRQIAPSFRAVLRGLRLAGGRVTVVRLLPVRMLTLFGLFGKPWKVPGDVAVADARNFAASNLEATLEALRGESFVGPDVTVPTTIAFFGFDPLIRRRQTHMEQLPADVVVVRNRWCGHVPTWDDPAWCAATIRATAARAVP